MDTWRTRQVLGVHMPHTHMCVRKHMCTYTHNTHAHTNTHTYICTHTCVRAHRHTQHTHSTHMPTHTCAYRHTTHMPPVHTPMHPHYTHPHTYASTSAISFADLPITLSKCMTSLSLCKDSTGHNLHANTCPHNEPLFIPTCTFQRKQSEMH